MTEEIKDHFSRETVQLFEAYHRSNPSKRCKYVSPSTIIIDDFIDFVHEFGHTRSEAVIEAEKEILLAASHDRAEESERQIKIERQNLEFKKRIS